MFSNTRSALLATIFSSAFLCAFHTGTAHAEDCTGSMPFVNCTLDEDTTAPLLIEQNIVLTISAGGLAPGVLTIGHTIDGNTNVTKGEIITIGNGGTIIQEADIGVTKTIHDLTINSGDIWYLSNDADIVLEGIAEIDLNGGILGIGPDSALSTISAGILGGSGDDILDYISGGVSYGTTGTIGRAGNDINLRDGDDRILYYQSAGSIIAADNIYLGTGNNEFGVLGTSSGSIFNGDIVGGANVDILVFYSGSDAIVGSSSTSIYFGLDDDIIDFDSGTGVAGGTLYANLIDLNDGNDFVNLTDNASLILTSGGSFDLGDDEDLISFTSGGYLDARGAAFNMGDGDDVLEFNNIAFVSGTSGMNVEDGTFTMGDGNDSIIFVSNQVSLNAGSNTTINLGGGDDRIVFRSETGGTITSVDGAGFLHVNGGLGDDVIFFGSSADIYFGDNTASGSFANVEIIDVGDGTLTYYGTMDSTANIVNFTSVSFYGDGSDIMAYLSGDATSESILFASGATYYGSSNLGLGDETLTFSSATLGGTINLDDGDDNVFIGGDSIVSGLLGGGGNVNDTLVFTSGLTTITGTISGFTDGQLYSSAIVNVRSPSSIMGFDLFGTGTLQFGSAGTADDTYYLTNTIDGVAIELVGDTLDTNGIDLGQTTPLRGLTINEDTLMIIDSNIDLADGSGSTFSVDGTARFEQDAVVTADRYDSTTTGAFIFEIDYDGTSTTLGTIALQEAGQSIDFSSATGSGDTFSFVLGPSSMSLVTDTVSFVSAGAGGTVTGPEAANVSGSTILYDITLTDADANPEDLELVVTQINTIEDLTDTENNETIATVLLNGLLNSTEEGIVAIREALLQSDGPEAFNTELEAASPILDRSEFDGIDKINRRTFGLINQRLAMLRKDTNGNTGISTGNLAEELEVWWQFYAESADQDAMGGITGYESTTYGLATGIDKELFEDGFFGLSFAWGETSANSKGAGDSDTEVDSYQLGLYGDYDFGRAYINGMVSYSYNDTSTAKTSAAGTRTANYHSNGYAARAEMGYTFLTGKTRLIPYIMGHYGYYSPESYTEEGGGAQTITYDSIKVMELGTGFNLQWLITNDESSYFVPEMRFGYRYDFADEAVNATVQYGVGGPMFEMQGADPSEQAFDFGVGMTYFSKEDWELVFNYDMEYRQDYLSHAGMVRAAYKFLQ